MREILILLIVASTLSFATISAQAERPSTPVQAPVANVLNLPVIFSTVQNPNLCVTQGGRCDGTIPCCDPNVNYCIRKTCRPFPDEN